MDIFISYKKEEKPVAGRLAGRLTEAGYSVWWDAALLAGDSFEDEIKTGLSKCKVVVVLWSKAAVASRWVRNEAEYAREKKNVLPIIIDDLPESELPFLFQHLHVVRLRDWNGELTDPGFEGLLKSITAKIGAPGPTLSANAASAKLADSELEAAEWAEISGAPEQVPDEYRRYLQKFGPAGRYADLARLRIVRLEHGQAEALAPPQSRPSRLPAAPRRKSWTVRLLSATLAIALGLLAWRVAPEMLDPPHLPDGSWTTHQDPFGFAIDIPPGFVARGATNVFVWRNATLTIGSGDTPYGSFRKQVETLQRGAEDNGASITYSGSDRAHFSGYTDASKQTIYYYGALALCYGTQYAAFRLEYPSALSDAFNVPIATLVQNLRATGWTDYCHERNHTSGVIRSAQGFAPLTTGTTSGAVIAQLPAGAKLTIKDMTGSWYKVVTDDGASGYVSQSNVKVDGYAGSVSDDQRFIQVASFSDLDGAQAFIHAHAEPMAVYLSTNGTFVVAMAQTYPAAGVEEALQKVIASDPNFPRDAFETYGNLYVRLVQTQ